MWGLGYTTILLANPKKKITTFFEANIMRLGIGIATFMVVATTLNLLRISLDWKIFLALSLIVPIWHYIKKKPKFNFCFPLTKSNLYAILIFLMFAFSFYMYHEGSFVYPYLENDDPWEHARSAKYISIEKTAYEPGSEDLFRYIDPYPPGFPILMGVLHQTNDSIHWTLKFFNALLISLSIVFFYFFVRRFTQSEDKALFATFVLTVIPSYLSHFIWAHSIVPLLFFITFYSLEKISDDRKWQWVAAIAIASIFVVHPSQSIKFVFFFAAYVFVKWIMKKELTFVYVKSIIVGGILSLTWWATKVVSMLQERVSRIEYLDAGLTSADTSFWYKVVSFAKNYFTPNMGTATRPYSFNDFFVAKDANMINNPIGLGVVVTILLVISLFFLVIYWKKYWSSKKSYIFISLLWLLITFLIVNSATFNIPGLFGFRTWMLMVIPISILVAEGVTLLMRYARPFGKLIPLVLVLGLAIGLIYTSGMPKYAVNTANWPPGQGWTSMQEIQLYLWFNSVPKGTKVFPFSGSQNNELIGLDMYHCDWCVNERSFREKMLSHTPAETHAFLTKEGYKYLLLDTKTFMVHQETLGNTTQPTIIKLFETYARDDVHYTPVFQNQGGVVLQVK